MMVGRISAVAGSGFAALFGAMKRVRPHRPIHPDGVYLTGSLERQGSVPPTGIGWIDDAGTDVVQARISRGAGLPAGWPDIVGLALRVPAGPQLSQGPADVLFSTTGFSRLGRFLLQPRRHIESASFGTLMPYRGTGGPVLLAARPESPSRALPASRDEFRAALGGDSWTLGLYCASLWGRWRRFATLSLTLVPGQPDTDLRFDPVLHPPAGAKLYGWTRRIRLPAYARARQPVRRRR